MVIRHSFKRKGNFNTDYVQNDFGKISTIEDIQKGIVSKLKEQWMKDRQKSDWS